MLKIRLRRTGKRNQPHYRVVVAEHTAPVSGKFVAILGRYNPRTKEFVVNAEEALRWLSQGAQASNTMTKLLLAQGLTHPSLVVHQYKERPSKKASDEKPATEKPAAATTSDDETAEVAESPATAEEAPTIDAEATAVAESPKEETVEPTEQPTTDEK